MPSRMREAFALRVVEGLDASETCRILEITSANLWTLLYRARERLRAASKASGITKGNSDMFSCRKATRRTLDLLERPLSPIERMGRWGHLALCRHCRAHSRQIRRLLFVLERKDHLSGNPLPRLSTAARERIAAAVGQRLGE